MKDDCAITAVDVFNLQSTVVNLPTLYQSTIRTNLSICCVMYIELHTSSAFSFLQAASLPETLVEQAARYG